MTSLFAITMWLRIDGDSPQITSTLPSTDMPSSTVTDTFVEGRDCEERTNTIRNRKELIRKELHH
jgi:hypothetical protein